MIFSDPTVHGEWTDSLLILVKISRWKTVIGNRFGLAFTFQLSTVVQLLRALKTLLPFTHWLVQRGKRSHAPTSTPLVAILGSRSHSRTFRNTCLRESNHQSGDQGLNWFCLLNDTPLKKVPCSGKVIKLIKYICCIYNTSSTFLGQRLSVSCSVLSGASSSCRDDVWEQFLIDWRYFRG